MLLVGCWWVDEVEEASVVGVVSSVVVVRGRVMTETDKNLKLQLSETLPQILARLLKNVGGFWAGGFRPFPSLPNLFLQIKHLKSVQLY